MSNTPDTYAPGGSARQAAGPAVDPNPVERMYGSLLPLGRLVADARDPMTAHEVLTALFELKQGRVTLTAEQQAEFLDAVEGLVRALIEALRGGDRMAAAMWYAHDRTPALARFADAARP